MAKRRLDAEDHARVVVAMRNSVAEDPALESLAKVDRAFASRVVTSPSASHTRLVLSPCGDLQREMDDVRRVGEAAAKGAQAAFAMGASQISLVVDPAIVSSQHPIDGAAYANASLVAELAVHQAAYVMLQGRTAAVPRKSPLGSVSVECGGPAESRTALAIEQGLGVARDIGSGDPECMAPPAMAEYIREACKGTGVEVEIVSDQATLEAEYPLLMAVSRADRPVERHHARVVRLSWTGAGPVDRTVLIAGKGVTYDTGGADIKVGGSMAGMRRDKCGGAATAGFLIACSQAPPELTRGLRVVAEIGCVRNSVGADMYVADEVITSHAGKRVLIGNTDAEGRMVLADCLSHLRQQALEEKAVNPTVLSLATLTGHAARSFGGYGVAIDNGAARAAGGVGPRLAAAGAALGQPLEVSVLRRDDFAFIAPGSGGTSVARCGDAYDVLQSNNAATAVTVRGHQFPMAFLIIASGLQDHGAGSERPLPYCHVDLAGSIVDGRGVETGSPILPLFGHFVMRPAGALAGVAGASAARSAL